jgi:hypothetical protein
MYILNYNPTDSRIEANFGGYITSAEAEVFVEEFRGLLLELGDKSFEVVMDYAMVPKMDEGVIELLSEARDTSLFAGAQCVTFVARNDDEAYSWVDSRLQAVLDGREKYVAYALAA